MKRKLDNLGRSRAPPPPSGLSKEEKNKIKLQQRSATQCIIIYKKRVAFRRAEAGFFFFFQFQVFYYYFYYYSSAYGKTVESDFYRPENKNEKKTNAKYSFPKSSLPLNLSPTLILLFFLFFLCHFLSNIVY